ncbi:hypothetical protein BKA58DRAFT_421353 [Alternaria rosae]|uniref:uncharacterized protein n=1 Tax=Alternaria rosae TaxID=1187941 RepID=UPI001E8ED528|nr:uncharacterized protein BKA58DRAFT_421353 [Alternaria rosae]KAH6867967.1 hypothetical protein BKA58DRAFT_421353 [Alternaria rosae]
MSRTLYILYNADASIMGKLRYGYRKICHSSEENPACAACDITHGGLSLKETPAWVEAKKAIEAESGYHIVQWHKDELSGEVKKFVESNSIRYPTIVSSGSDGGLSEIMNNLELAACKGNAQSVISRLREKGIMQQKEVSSSL